MGYTNTGKVGCKWFCLGKSNTSNKTLEFYTSQFDIDDYYIFKRTKRFKEVSKEVFYSFEYMGYILFNKNHYDKDFLDMWILWLKNYPNSLQGFIYLNCPFPPFNPEKIKIY